ncbi:YdcF family protein [Nocardia huaxiensis]|nr:YdcF family protein [Nocardia huaxiensis]
MRRSLRRTILTALIVIMALGGAGVPVYVRPQVDPLRRADAILVLGGNGVDRYLLGLELARQGYAENVLYSNPFGADTELDEVREPCRSQYTEFTLRCFAPDPPTTVGEGRALRRIASEKGWRTIIVVTMVPHLSRARYILEQCFDGELIMTPSDENLSAGYMAWQYVYQTAGFMRAFLQRGC